MEEKIKVVDLGKDDLSKFEENPKFTGCLVVTADNKILLQQRPDDWWTHPGFLSTFGGKIEEGESPELAIVRELNEELGAKVEKQDLIFLGAVTEKITDYSELVYHYFWKDTKNRITGCYECAPKYYSNPKEAMQHPKIMDDVLHLLRVCEERGLV